MISLASATHSLHSAVPCRPSSFFTSASSLPHHEHTFVARGRSTYGSSAAAAISARISGIGTLNSPVVPTESELPVPSALWQAPHTMTSSPPSSACAQMGHFTRPNLTRSRERDHHLGPFPELGVDVDAAAVLGDHRVRGREAQARAFRLGREERVEDPAHDFLGDARSIVLDDDARA